MRVVVTGATGFVGTGVVNELLKQNTDVTVIVRNATQLPCYWNGKVTVIEADLSSIHLLERADFGKEKIDVFSISHGVEQQAMNVQMLTYN